MDIKLFCSEVNLLPAIDVLNAHYEHEDVLFVTEDDIRNADLILTTLGDENKYPQPSLKIDVERINEAYFALQKLISAGVLLPVPEVVPQIEAMVTRFERNWERLISGKAVPYKNNVRSSEYGGSVAAKCFAVFHDHTKKCEPELHRRLTQRTRRIERKRDSYFPLVTRLPQEDSIYGHLIVGAEEHTARVEKYRSKFESLGVTLSPANLAYTQMGIGMPFFGGFNREQQGFTDPDVSFEAASKMAARFMVSGLREFLKGVDDPSKVSTRATVKVDSFQGAPTLSANHLDLQSCWKYMAMHPKGIFAFEDRTFPVVIGFRLSDPGSSRNEETGKIEAKRRRAFVLEKTGLVGLDRVRDGDDFPDDPHFGARVRHVDNPSAIQNNAFAPCISYISDHKGWSYKILYQQDTEYMLMRVPGTREHAAFWEAAYNARPAWLVAACSRLNIKSAKELISYLIDLGEFPCAGDVENFDGNTTWKVAKPFYSALLSPRLLKLLERMWNSSSIGTYIDAEGQVVWYVIDKTDPRTAELSDHFPSGQQLTSVGGRGVMTALLADFDTKLLSCKLEDIFDGSSDPFQPFLYSCAEGGDDHKRYFALYSLITGKHPAELRDEYLKIQSACTLYKIAPESPPMACGFMSHLDDEGRLLAESLSAQRMAGNTLFPEYSKSAIGLDASLDHYCELASGTPDEYRTLDVANAIKHDIYGFDDELLAAAVEEDEFAIAQEAINGGAAQLMIAEMLGVSPSRLDYHYSWDSLLELGIPEELLAMWRQPIPRELSRDPRRFFNEEVLK